MEVELAKLDELHEDPANTRKHNDRNIDAIADSLKRFGQQKPIVVRPDGRIVAGNGTYRAARDKLGWTEIAVVRTDLDGPDAEAFATVDNRTAELAEWDVQALNKHIEAMREYDASVLIGWDQGELDEILNHKSQSDGSLQDAALAAMVNQSVYAVKKGDVWQLGPHRLVVACPVTEPAAWRDLIVEATMFFPFAGPLAIFGKHVAGASPKDGERLLIVQPSRKISEDILAAFAAVDAAAEVKKLSDEEANA